ncbi:probable 28S rRNA (cytosine-C(5))-methyltransferase [Orussus abietinus]|uniref:probable 28S rRNA (cytosine-C(5))-methyltransferase n=1 Tax=Orussus abietinus TaxID=222816 RepID=UPI0006268B36|nr:probable 28S rRNA (cytosine-C(5))-methyltransferase [Orussus abietinus]
MPDGFVHSVKVPRLYKTAAKVVQSVKEEGASLKELVYKGNHPNVNAIYALARETLQKELRLDYVLRKTQILFKEPRLDPWLARILITELFRKSVKPSECKPIKTILAYEKELREAYDGFQESEAASSENSKVQKPRYVRVNTLLSTAKEVITSFINEGWQCLSRKGNYSSFLESVSNLEDDTFLQDIHIPEVLIFPHGTKFHDHLAYRQGFIMLQDKASCFSTHLLRPEPGSVVLDMCAAPGLKTTHLAAQMNNQGKIYAVEMDEKRFNTLRETIQASMATCVEAIHADAMTVNADRCPNVEYILVDPSCSGSGMVDRVDSMYSSTECPPHRLKSLQAFQVLLLRHALFNFPSVKKVVYSTCSLYPQENEEVIDEILGDIGETYTLLPVRSQLNDNWLNYSSLEYKCKDNCMYARPKVDLCNGFFVAVFERNFDIPLPEYNRKPKVLKKESEECNEYLEPPSDKMESADSEPCKPKKMKKKKKHQSAEESANIPAEDALDEVIIIEEVPKKKHKKSKRQKTEVEENTEQEINKSTNESVNEGEALPEKPVKKKKKKKHAKKHLD